MVAPCDKPNRPALRWQGGKWRLAPWIVSHFPPHRTYVEPFGGAASVLIRKEPSYAEIYNDLDGDAVNLFRILRDPSSSARLIDLLRLTPFARDEFNAAYDDTGDAIEAARRLVVRSFMGFGSSGHTGRCKTGFRGTSKRASTTPAHDWHGYPDCLARIVRRFGGVTVEHRTATEVMQAHDAPDTLHYVDPPYIPETRSRTGANSREVKHQYKHEMTAADHAGLLAFLLRLDGLVILSGYDSPLYASALAGWTKETRKTHADGARSRTESLWINPAALAARGLLIYAHGEDHHGSETQ